ncbi:MAG: 4'-phosphopantetheinyl transferase superfamily protein [Saprospiraceae bacterium]|nr:4'-phosphopantetheinyl transferase superfamily protein [Saprospiraceae bacterium]MCF8251958.1 4'-phosphopantetheinyl transferase superfamily protein [Saprospiraceae bacterium]MCF8282767.1 4'-phosphopantetheinyl transferase superfamily protein [Bacteroidales bacterium]MCF8313638.1 4'-phosphopantetheinyl transferase superfamily protein [Saprospiraceae bacterium]MCF8442345.1 4'-phosphopantetheinyl transferase superfamily protein [Saprospiraceae bacterium]
MKESKQDVIQLLELPNEPGLGGVRVLLFDAMKLPSHLTFEVGKLLSPIELRKSAKYRFTKDRIVYLTGRGMLRKLGSEMLKLPAEELVIKERQYGKPYLEGFEKRLPFNLSNSGNMISIAFEFTEREIGLDIEVIDKSFNYWEVAGNYFSKRECDMVYSHRDFYRFWTMKEALLKVTGVGLIDDLNKVDLSGKMNRVAASDERLLPFKDKAFTLYTFDNEQIVFTIAVAGAQHSEYFVGNRSNSNNLTVRHVYFY